MNYETKQAYSEVYAVLQYMPNEYLNKIPDGIFKLFEKERLSDYKVNINKENPIDKNYLSRKAMTIIAMLNYYYWCPNKKVKNDLYKMYLANNEKYEKRLKEDENSVENLFKSRSKSNYNYENVNEEIDNYSDEENYQALVEYNKGFWSKILNKIKSFFIRKK